MAQEFKEVISNYQGCIVTCVDSPGSDYEQSGRQ